MFNKVLKAILLLSPICYMTGFDLNTFDTIFFQLSVGALFCASLYDEPIRKVSGNYFIAFIVIAGINVLTHRLSPEITFNFLNYFLAVFALVLMVRHIDKPKEHIKYVLYAMTINAVVFAFQKWGFNPILTSTSMDFPGGIMGNAPRLTTYFAIAIPLLAFIHPLLAVPFGAIALWGNTQVAPIVTCVAVVGVWIYEMRSKIDPRYRKLKYGLAIIVSLASLCFFYKLHKSGIIHHIIGSFKTRLAIWAILFSEYFKTPLIGIGIGKYVIQTPKGLNFDHAYHSSVFQYIASVGILGFLWIHAIGKEYLKKWTFSKEDLFILCLIVVSMVEYPFEVKRMWMTILFGIAVYLIKKRRAL